MEEAHGVLPYALPVHVVDPVTDKARCRMSAAGQRANIRESTRIRQGVESEEGCSEWFFKSFTKHVFVSFVVVEPRNLIYFHRFLTDIAEHRNITLTTNTPKENASNHGCRRMIQQASNSEILPCSACGRGRSLRLWSSTTARAEALKKPGR